MKVLITVFLSMLLAGCDSDDDDRGGGVNGTTDSGLDGDSGPDGGGGGSSNNADTSRLATNLVAVHRSGQTFLTWNEPDDSTQYHVYRASQPLTSANLSSASWLTNRWGPLDANSSINPHGTSDVAATFVIEDFGSPLGDDQGLFVHTTQPGEQGNAWYAVSSVVNGSENRAIVTGFNATSAAVSEFVAIPGPVLNTSINDGKGRIYTHYMDYANWNPTFNGYAFSYTVALPYNYDSTRSYPLQLHLHAYGGTANFLNQSDYGWPVIQVFANDPGEATGTFHTWWYGHAADHNYVTSGDYASSGRVENFTEQRLLKAIDEVIANPQLNVNTDLIHAYGNSMGASGVLALGLRYPDVFAGIYASEPMTNYATNPLFQDNFNRIWGSQGANLPISNNGPRAQAIADYDADGSQPTSVWNWMNHQQQLRRRRGDNFAFLMMDFGKDDNVIDWQTQGRPMFAALSDANAPFAATALGGIGHNWLAFNAINHSLFGLGNDAEAGWLYPASLSYPGLQNATGSGAYDPGPVGDDEYNQNIEWSTPHFSFHQNIVDTGNRYEISLRSTAGVQTVDVTPRNTNAFRPAVGSRCTWSATRLSDNQQTGNGSATVDGDELLTVAAVPVDSGAGTRLVINCN